MAYHHNSVSMIFVFKMCWCCGAWSILQVVEKNAEAHLIALNLVLESMSDVLLEIFYLPLTSPDISEKQVVFVLLSS